MRRYPLCFILGIVLSAGAFWACQEEETFKPRTISDVIIEDSRFSVFRAVLKQSGMSDALRTNVLTVFAPNDEAFKKMSISDPGQVSGMSTDSLMGIVQYLVLEGAQRAEDFPEGVKQKIQALDGSNLFITKNADGFKVNMATVKATDIAATNGIIHEIDHVPSSSKLNLVQWLSTNPSFTFLSAAATKAASYNPALTAQLMADSASFTLFAPTNQAFADAGFPTLQSIQEANAEILAAILANHIFNGAYFSTELKTGQIGSIMGAPVLINVGGVITVAGNGNSGTLPTISRSDILTKNGVIHILDGVLIP